MRESSGNKFIEQMKMVNPLSWKAKYIKPGVCDGTQWRVKIITDRRTIMKIGDNMFPEEWEQKE